MKLAQLLTALDRHPQRVPIDDLRGMLERLDIDRAEIAHLIRFVDQGYARNLVKVGPGYAALILCWRPGQSSPIHDHRGSSCGVRVIQGTVTETRYQRGDGGLVRPTTTRRLMVGEVCGSADADIHRIRNDERSADLVTLHVYTPIMRGCGIYREDSPEVTLWNDDLALAAQSRLVKQPAPA
jgi:cysteine dioxygenase